MVETGRQTETANVETGCASLSRVTFRADVNDWTCLPSMIMYLATNY